MKKIDFRHTFLRGFTWVALASLPLAARGKSSSDIISMNVHNATVVAALEQVNTAAGSNIVNYKNQEVARQTKRVTAKMDDVTVLLAVNTIIDGTNLRAIDRQSEVLVTPAAIQQPQRQRLYNVGGIVTDEQGKPMQGVAVQVAGTGRGTSTDARGQFVLSGIQMPATFAFSFMGYETREVRVTTDEIVRVTLRQAVIQTKAAIVTGYETISEKHFPGSVVRMKPDSLLTGSGLSIEQMMQGKLPGTLITNTSGLVGTRQKVRVRGTSTLLGNQEPVWVVDGIIQDDPLPFKAQELNTFDPDSFDMMRDFVGSAISWLNPNDIEDITVLKDAVATVLYGVKAANGVIVIKTKKGQAGRMAVNYSGGLTVTPRLNYNKMNLMNSKERIAVSKEIFERKLYGPRGTNMVGYEKLLSQYQNKEISYEEFNDGVKYLEGVNTDWFDILFQTPLSHNHSLGISGGTENLTYYSSIGATQTFGTARGNNSKQFTGNVNIDARIGQRLTVSVGMGASTRKTNAFYGVDPYTYATTTSRAIPFTDENGELFFYNRDNTANMYNIQHELNNTGNWNEGRALNLNVSARYKIMEGLEFSSQFGYTQNNSHAQSWATERSYKMAGPEYRNYEYGAYDPSDEEYQISKLPHGGELNTIDSRSSSWDWRNSLSFNKVWNDKHRLNVMLGQELRSNQSNDWRTTVYGYFPDRGDNISLPSPLIPSASGNIYNSLYDKMQHNLVGTLNNFISAYASANYSFNERYVASFSARTDASNRFGQNKRNRFMPVWSAGLRWNVHEEEWMKNKLHWISEFNMRASYGWQGNIVETVSPDLILTIPSDMINLYTGERMLNIRSLPYPDLRWEKVHSLNLGVDLGLFRNKVMVSAEYYYKSTVDMINNEPLPQEYGIPSMPVNAGRMLNRGIDLSVSFNPIRNQNFTWTVGMNTSKNFNRVESTIDKSAEWQAAVSGGLSKSGYPVSSFWAFDFLGVDQQTGMPMFFVPTAEENPAAVNDVTQYMKYMGKLEPDFQGGMSMNFRWKRLSVSTSFNVQIGGKKFLYKIFQGQGGLPSAYNNMPKEFADRWTPTNTGSNIPGLTGQVDIGDQQLSYPYVQLPAPLLPASDPENGRDARELRLGYIYDMYNYSSARVVNASFLRCTSIGVGYSLPTNWVNRMHLKAVSVRASLTNPFMIVSRQFKGMDPEVATGNQPVSRTVSMGVSVSF